MLYGLSDKKIMVLVPHEDDEINLIGGTLPLLIKAGAKVKVVYLTNGDFYYKADIRIKEAIKALSVLGIDDNDVVFLGYPDGSDSSGYSLYKTENRVRIKNREYTYGGFQKLEYRMMRYGQHGEYSYASLKKDLLDFILLFRPDIIFGTDFDGHHDHRMCSLALEECINSILLRKNNTYFPYVYKGFAYSTSFNALNDFYSLNIKNTVMPKKRELAYNTRSQLDNPVYSWENRIQFPVDINCAENFLFKNKLYMALLKHISQAAISECERIINADKVFWERPTENLLYDANIVGSSGDIEKLKDFRFFDVDDVSNLKLPIEYLFLGWIPDIADERKELILFFDEPKKLQEINLYLISQKKVKFNLVIDEKYNLSENDFISDDIKFTKKLSKQIIVKKLRFIINQSVKSSVKLIYMELLQNLWKPMRYVKISLNDNFAYNFNVLKDRKVVSYKIYNYGINSEIKLISDNQKVCIDKAHVYFSDNVDKFTLKAINTDNNAVLDEVNVLLINKYKYKVISLIQKIENVVSYLVYRYQRKWRKIRRYRYDIK